MDIKVIINGKIADLPPQGLNLPITYSLKDRNGLTINTGSRSEYAFELPATKQNSEIFNQFYDPAVLTNNEQVFLPAIIEVDGQTFFQGKCQLQSSTLIKDLHFWQGKTYKVAFYGNNADWAIQIGNLLIKDLPFTPHTYDYTNNISAWYYNYPTFDYKYLPFKLKDYTTFGQLDALEDSHPAIFVVDVLNKIFATIGYTINSNFFNTNFAQRLIMPVPLLNRYLQEDYGADYLNVQANENIIGFTSFYPILIFPNQTQAPTIGPNPYNTGTGVYTVPVLGYYLFEVDINITNITTSAGCSFGFSVNGNPITDVWGESNLGPPQPYTTDTLIRAEKVMLLNTGDTVAVAGIGVVVAPGTCDFVANLKVSGEAEIINGFQLNPKYVIDKSWKAIDFIKGLAHAFNLVFETIEIQKRVDIDPADEYLYESRVPLLRQIEGGFYTTSKSPDLTPKIDLSKGGELVSDTKKLNRLRLEWKEDSNDPTVQALNENEVLGILSAAFNFPSNRYKDGETVLFNPFFAPTLVIADNEIKDANSTKTPMIPFAWATNYLENSLSSEKPQQLLPRILVSDDTLNVGTGTENGMINVWDGTVIVQYPAPLNYMVDYNDSDGYQTSLSFGDEIINGFPVAGLLKRFYLAEMVRQKQGKYLEVFIYFDIIDIQNLTFKRKCYLNNNLYILQEINAFDVSKTRSTKTYFIHDGKEVNAQNDINSTTIQAKVNT